MTAEPGDALERVLSKFSGVIRNGSAWKALCPARADKDPSLSVAERDVP